MVSLSDIQQAQQRLNATAIHTPLIQSFHHGSSDDLFIKPEILQPIGSFKLRGAFNLISSLPEAERRRGVVTFSSGNHAQGVAYAARALGVKAVIVMPNNAPQVKLDSTRRMGAEIVLVGPASSERKQRAEQLEAEHAYIMVPPYADERIIAGGGTIGLEIARDLPDVGLVLVPVGGGGCISGIAAAVKLSGSKAKVVGVEPAHANDAQQSLRSGRIVHISAEEALRTIADALRTQAVGEINFEHMRKFVDDVVTVSDDEILEAMRWMALNTKMIAEPSGAVTVAAYLKHHSELPKAGKTVAVVTGGNADPALLAKVIGA